MAVNNEFASEVERLYKAEEVALEQHESQTTRIKELQHKLAKQSQAATNNVEEEKLNLELQIRQLKMCLENEKSENNKLRSDKQRVELDSSSREEVSIGILSDIFYLSLFTREKWPKLVRKSQKLKSSQIRAIK